jgi:hypothetical protein
MLRALLLATLAMSISLPARPQDSNFGITLPVTLSGGAMYTGRLQLAEPDNSPFSAGFQAMAYPTVTLGKHWFAYSALDFRLAPYLYYDAYDADHDWYVEAIQAFVGYQVHGEKTSFVLKAGRLSSAFGAFPLHYDDADNALLDQPLSYIQTLALRNDQLPCGVPDLLKQHYGYIWNGCGGPTSGGSGLTPVSLYGLPGVEAELSSHRWDGRIQVASGSPSDAVSVSHSPQYAQWVAGGGYTIEQGFRVGVSGFRGPYLAPGLAPALPLGASARDFPASGLGVDMQWARGRWSASGEWQRFQYDLPGFPQSPSVTSTYVEAKRILTPRFYVAGRAGWFEPGGARDTSGASTGQFSASIASYELGGGCWLNRYQLIKASYEWLRIENFPGTGTNVLGVEFVTRFHAVDRVFR